MQGFSEVSGKIIKRFREADKKRYCLHIRSFSQKPSAFHVSAEVFK